MSKNMKQKTEKHDEITLKLLESKQYKRLHKYRFRNYILGKISREDREDREDRIDISLGDEYRHILTVLVYDEINVYPEYALNYGYSIDILVKQKIRSSQYPEYTDTYASIFEIKPLSSINSISQVIRQINQYENLLTNIKTPCSKFIISNGNMKPEWESLLIASRIEFFNIDKLILAEPQPGILLV